MKRIIDELTENTVTVAKYQSLGHARQALDSMITGGCIGCRDCDNCVNCTDCEDCYKCTNLVGCIGRYNESSELDPPFIEV